MWNYKTVRHFRIYYHFGNSVSSFCLERYVVLKGPMRGAGAAGQQGGRAEVTHRPADGGTTLQPAAGGRLKQRLATMAYSIGGTQHLGRYYCPTLFIHGIF